MREKWKLLFLLVLASPILGFKNLTLEKGEFWETEGSCAAGKWGACLEGGAFASFGALLGKEYHLSKAAKLVRIDSNEVEEESRAEDSSGILTSIARLGDKFVKSAGIEIELTPDVTENGRFQPRFVDEIYSELNTLDLKHNKPNKQYELKRLFIPLLVILKVFKLKLLLLLPIILGLASFKKLIAVAVILLPAIIAYFKVCKPDLRQSYGSYGHSSYYNSPPSNSHIRYDSDGMAYNRMSYRGAPDHLAYRGHR